MIARSADDGTSTFATATRSHHAHRHRHRHPSRRPPSRPTFEPDPDHAEHRRRGRRRSTSTTPSTTTPSPPCARRWCSTRCSCSATRTSRRPPTSRWLAASVSSRCTPCSRTTPITRSWCCSAAPPPARRARTSTTATCRGGQTPSMASLLRCVECPPAGGDTIWVNMALAYENLPDSLKPQLAVLEAVHDLMPAFGPRMTPEQREANRRTYPPMVHPVVRTHPESGEQILYVNEAFTTHLANYAAAFEPARRLRLQDGRDGPAPLPAAPGDHPRVPDAPAVGSRTRWSSGTTARPSTTPIQDYFPAVRRMMRATVIGDRPR